MLWSWNKIFSADVNLRGQSQIRSPSFSQCLSTCWLFPCNVSRTMSISLRCYNALAYHPGKETPSVVQDCLPLWVKQSVFIALKQKALSVHYQGKQKPQCARSLNTALVRCESAAVCSGGKLPAQSQHSCTQAYPDSAAYLPTRTV